MTPFLSKQFISVHVRVILVDIITLAVGTPGLPVGAIIKKTKLDQQIILVKAVDLLNYGHLFQL